MKIWKMKNSYLKSKNYFGAGDLAQVPKRLPGKHQLISSILSTRKRKKSKNHS